MKHKRGNYDPDTKSLDLTAVSTKDPVPPAEKTWAVDPQLQIIRLLTDIKILLGNQLKRTAPYHTGPQAVSIAPVSQPAVQDPPLPPVSLEQSKKGEF